ncbi:MAG: hypothetical protein M4579_003347 [Chaenotheca gracillima]|nr:MAG: hypothetical protein M4579_003347 [Chaenotheca gracillima]
MVFSGAFFSFFRLCEIVTLIPTLGMMAYFVHGYVSSNVLTPTYILVLFIISVLAAAWAIFTLIMYGKTKRSARGVALVDLAIMGTFIAAVYELRGIAKADCTNFTSGRGSFYFDLGVFGSFGATYNSQWSINTNKTCAMLKASFAFGIMNILFFFMTFLFALLVHHHHRHDNVVKETHVRRHSHRRGSRGSQYSHRSGRRPAYV